MKLQFRILQYSFPSGLQNLYDLILYKTLTFWYFHNFNDLATQKSIFLFAYIYIFPIHQSERYVDGWNYNISGCYKCQVAILDRQGKKFWEVKVCDMPVAYMRNSVLHHAGLMLKGMEVFDVLTFWKKKSVLINYEVTHNLKAGLHQTRS